MVNFKELGLVNTRDMFAKAIKGGYAIPAFNFNNMEQLQAIIKAASETKSPVILQVSKGARNYANATLLRYMAQGAVEYAKELGWEKPQICLHLDHGDSFETCKSCVDFGFSSVMIDGSHLPYEENIALTKKVVEYAHAHDVTVEAELGVLAGVEDEVSAAESHYTKPEEVVDFATRTGCDSLRYYENRHENLNMAVRKMIETERLILRPFLEADAEDVFEYLKKPMVNCFACMKVNSLEEAKNAVLDRSKDKEYYFAIVLKENGKVIGEIDAMPETPAPDERNAVLDTFSPCWMLNKNYHGKGYAFEAAQAFFNYLFYEKGARRIYAYTEDYNVSSQKLCEKLGMRREGMFKEFITFINDEDGNPIYENTIQYAILKKEWLR